MLGAQVSFETKLKDTGARACAHGLARIDYFIFIFLSLSSLLSHVYPSCLAFFSVSILGTSLTGPYIYLKSNKQTGNGKSDKLSNIIFIILFYFYLKNFI